MIAKAKVLITIAFLLLCSFFLIKPTVAQNCNTKDECQSLIEQYEKKLTEVRSQKNTLSSQISLMDTQINLTTVQIKDTEYKIAKTEDEILNLTDKIEGLNTSLDYLGKILLKKVVQGYKHHEVPFFNVFLDSDNAATLARRYKYIKTAEENDRKIAFQVQQAKQNFEQQKNLREEKKIELDRLQANLSAKKIELDNQKAAKQKLLIDTQSSEVVYQRLLAQAQAQIAAFSSFVRTSGASSTIGANAFGSGSDGAYYSQRDERWAYKAIGYSSENVLNVGCLLSSVAMVATHYGQSLTPLDVASDVNRFYGNTAWMLLPWRSVAGRSYYGGVNVDQELQNGNYVIVGVGGCANGGSHFVVLTRKDGSDYIMHDPIFGPDIKFSSHYGNICSAATFK